MAVRSRRVTDPVVLAVGAGSTMYVVPADRTLIVRGIAIANATGPTATVARLHVLTPAGAVGFLEQPLAAGARTFWSAQDDLILNPGDSLVGISDNGLVRTMTFGSLLLGAPA